MKYNWKCTVCGLHKRYAEKQFPIHHCDVRHEFPLGVIDEVSEEDSKTAEKKRSDFHGVGFFLREIFDDIGIYQKTGCSSCKQLMQQMNVWGPEGCRLQMDEIVSKLEEKSKKFNWSEKVSAAGVLAKKNPRLALIMAAHPFNMFQPLVEEAIRRYEEYLLESPPAG